MRTELLITHRNLQICSTLLVQLQVRYFISAYISASSIRAARDASFWNSFCKSEENFETGCDRKMTTSASFSSMLNFVRFCNLRAEVYNATKSVTRGTTVRRKLNIRLEITVIKENLSMRNIIMY